MLPSGVAPPCCTPIAMENFKAGGVGGGGGHLRSVSWLKDMAHATLDSLETSEGSVFTGNTYCFERLPFATEEQEQKG